jgi:menaquinone-dependent protoporphyrinogen oxidase
MNILVAAASKHGSTSGIAEMIAEEFKARAIEAVAIPIEEPVDPAAFSAAVIGSAIYAGHWMSEGKRFLEHHRETLLRMPVWLFSSGPLGDSEHSAVDQTQIDELVALVGAREHVVFAGKLDPADLNVIERVVVKVVGAPTGDYREWDSIRQWTDSIADSLEEMSAAG